MLFMLPKSAGGVIELTICAGGAVPFLLGAS
jgi:hypothetical protein